MRKLKKSGALCWRLAKKRKRHSLLARYQHGISRGQMTLTIHRCGHPLTQGGHAIITQPLGMSRALVIQFSGGFRGMALMLARRLKCGDMAQPGRKY